MPPSPSHIRALVGAAVACCVLALTGAGVAAAATVHVAAHQRSAPVAGSRVFFAPAHATNLAVHWLGDPRAHVRVALSRDGHRFGRPLDVEIDDAAASGAPRRGTFGSVMVADGVRAARIYSDRPLPRVSVVWMDGRAGAGVAPVRASSLARRSAAVHAAAVAQPAVTSRAGWGADESLRFDSSGKEIWPAAFYPVQKLIVHHTDTQNNDPNPAATVRAIYRYHAVTEGWGDIGYNFLIDESGRIYEGRHSVDHPAGVSPTGADSSGRGVTAAHAAGFNSGTVGIALLGTLTSQDATPAARASLERLLAWESSTHGIDPQGASLFTNPVNGTQKTFANIAGHRDVNATECPGGVFYATLPSLRTDVARLVAGQTPAPDFALTASPTSRSVTRGQRTTYSMSITRLNGLSSGVALKVSGLPPGASASFAPNPAGGSSATLTVATTSSATRGTFGLTIGGSGAGITHSVRVTLQVK